MRKKPPPKAAIVQQTMITPPPPASVSGKDPWFKSIMTDHNGDFDLGAVLVGVVVNAMCLISAYDVMITHVKFDPQQFGIGIGAVLAGFAAYKFGDAKRPPGVSVTTTTATEPQ